MLSESPFNTSSGLLLTSAGGLFEPELVHISKDQVLSCPPSPSARSTTSSVQSPDELLPMMVLNGSIG